jgi:hypothetical protein
MLVSELPGNGRRYECPPDPRCAGKPVETSVFSPSVLAENRRIPVLEARRNPSSLPLRASSMRRLS